MSEEIPEQQISSPRSSASLSKERIILILLGSAALIVLILLAIRYWPDVRGETNANVSGQALSNTVVSGLELRNDRLTESAQDNDGDGLSNDQELSLGTDPDDVDTDSDFLFDREEVEVYQTDPLVADTDRDGFLDGEEVQDKFNPNGPGSLLNFDEARNGLDSQ